MSSPNTTTQWLVELSKGDARALDELLPLVYTELHRLAEHYLRGERPDHTLQPTALVHEAYLRLIEQENVTWQNRAHFVGVAARVMRRILVDHAVRRKTEKRGGGWRKVSLDEAIDFFERRDVNLTALEAALQKLEELDERQSRIVELRFFGGLTVEETAEALSVSQATVYREWSVAKMWLHRELERK